MDAFLTHTISWLIEEKWLRKTCSTFGPTFDASEPASFRTPTCSCIPYNTVSQPWTTPGKCVRDMRSLIEAGLHWVCSDQELANSQYCPSTMLHTWHLTNIFTSFTSSNQCDSNVLNFIANGGELSEQTVFECRSTFEPSNWPYLEKNAPLP